MIYGITKTEEKIIKNILSPYFNEYDFYYYGSRVKGNFEKTSDLDILIKGLKSMPFNILEEIKEAFDNSHISYVVNFSDYNKIDNEFYNIIKKDLRPIIKGEI
ncbi:MAG: nucleotidyltransferase domain-containing protein [Alphaproteobacteria bacterium]